MQQIFQTAQEKMEKSINALMNEYATIRAGRATPAVLDRITVDYYGCPTPIQQMAAISVPEPRTILITPEEYMERFMNADGDSSAEEK